MNTIYFHDLIILFNFETILFIACDSLRIIKYPIVSFYFLYRLNINNYQLY